MPQASLGYRPAGRYTAPAFVLSGWPRKSLDAARSPEHHQHMDIRIQCLCIDTADPARIASFWESALGWRRTWEEEDQVCLEPPEGSPEDGIAPDLIFLKVPEGKTVKNRLHLDLRPADQDAEVARLQALGARQVSIGQGDVSWVVMADPDGNEFDVLQPLTPDELPTGHDALGRRIAAGARA
jgi:predicted enzyme related to lactoylglutathione lyase